LASDSSGNTALSSLTTKTTINTQITNTSDLTDLVASINERTAVTGIQASIGSNGKSEVILSSEDGRDILIEGFNGANISVQGLTFDTTDGVGFTDAGAATTLTAGGTDSTRLGGYLQFNSASALNVQVIGGTNTTLLSGAAGVNNSKLFAASTISIANIDGASAAVGILDASIEQVNNLRASLGAVQNRLQSTVANLNTSSENLQFSNSRVRDADIAMESSDLARAQVLMQSGISVLAQANQQPQMALKLLG